MCIVKKKNFFSSDFEFKDCKDEEFEIYNFQRFNKNIL